MIDSLEVRGNRVPDSFMGDLKARNMAEKANADPEVARILERLEEITVRDGALCIVPRR